MSRRIITEHTPLHSDARETNNYDSTFEQKTETESASNEILKVSSIPVLEPVIFILLFALNLSSAVYQNQVIYQVCTTVYKYNIDDCSRLGSEEETNVSKKIEKEIQPYVAKIFMVQTILENAIPALGCLLIGPWSDKFGRKPIIIAAFTGFSFKYIAFALIAFLSTKIVINPWFYILAVIPEIILGGNSSFSIGCFSYIRDITNSETRPFRMIVYEICLYLGLVVGAFCSSYIFLATNAITVLAITAFIVVILTIFIVLFLKESLQISRENLQSSKWFKFCAIFQLSLVKDAFKTTFKRRQNYDRAIIMLILAALGFYSFIIRANVTIFFLFLRRKFSWTVKGFNTLESIGIGIQVIGQLFGVIILRKVFGFSAVTLALLAFGSATLDAVAKATASKSWHIYLSTALGLLKGVGGPMCLTILSIVIPPNETGKIFSFSNALQYFLPLGSAPFYTYVYDKTLDTFPSAFIFISVGLFFICFIFVSCIYTVKRSHPNIYGTF